MTQWVRDSMSTTNWVSEIYTTHRVHNITNSLCHADLHDTVSSWYYVHGKLSSWSLHEASSSGCVTYRSVVVILKTSRTQYAVYISRTQCAIQTSQTHCVMYISYTNTSCAEELRCGMISRVWVNWSHCYKYEWIEVSAYELFESKSLRMSELKSLKMSELNSSLCV